jgi:hypothetical protein
MTTIIFNSDGRPVSQSHNLAGLFTWARRAGGVTAMQCHVFPFTDASYPLSVGDPREKWMRASRPRGYLVATLANGFRAETWFSCGSHLVDWARVRAKPRRNSWFSGASVDVIHHDAWVNMGCGGKV